MGGTEIYTRNLLDALARNDRHNFYFVFRNRETEASIVPAQSNFVDCPQPVRAIFRPGRIVYEQTGFLFAVFRRRLDVLLNAGSTAPLLAAVPMVTIFYDLQYEVYPQNFRPLDLAALRVLWPAAARRSRRIVVMSEAARAQLERFYPWCAARIDLVPHGIEHRFSEIFARRARASAPRRYLLAVSTLGAHKNYDGLLRAYARYRASRPDVDLIVVGVKGPRTQMLETLRDELGLAACVRFTGWIEREELYRFYEGALAFVYASHFEGFGIPVLEALAAGLPTACSSIPSLVEIVQGAARLFDPNDTEDIAAALQEITSSAASLPNALEAGRRRAESFGSDASALRLLATLRRAAPSLAGE